MTGNTPTAIPKPISTSSNAEETTRQMNYYSTEPISTSINSEQQIQQAVYNSSKPISTTNNPQEIKQQSDYCYPKPISTNTNSQETTQHGVYYSPTPISITSNAQQTSQRSAYYSAKPISTSINPEEKTPQAVYYSPKPISNSSNPEETTPHSVYYSPYIGNNMTYPGEYNIAASGMSTKQIMQRFPLTIATSYPSLGGFPQHPNEIMYYPRITSPNSELLNMRPVTNDKIVNTLDAMEDGFARNQHLQTTQVSNIIPPQFYGNTLSTNSPQSTSLNTRGSIGGKILDYKRNTCDTDSGDEFESDVELDVSLKEKQDTANIHQGKHDLRISTNLVNVVNQQKSSAKPVKF